MASTGQLLSPAELGTVELNQILEIDEDSEGRIWVASNTGLASLDPQSTGWSVQRWNADGLQDVGAGVRGVEHDDRGWVWVVTRDEIVRFDPTGGTPASLQRYGPAHGTHRNLPTDGIRKTDEGWMLVPSFTSVRWRS